MSFSAWKSLPFAHFLTVANKQGEGREAAADRAGSSRCLCCIPRGDGVLTGQGNVWVDASFFKEKKFYSVVPDSLKLHGLNIARQAPLSVEFSRHNTGVGSHSVLQGRRESS